jgi:hypothetical protein
MTVTIVAVVVAVDMVAVADMAGIIMVTVTDQVAQDTCMVSAVEVDLQRS